MDLPQISKGSQVTKEPSDIYLHAYSMQFFIAKDYYGLSEFSIYESVDIKSRLGASKLRLI